MEKGRFIAFEGIDGSGKTTQAKILAEALFSKSKFNHVMLTREPYSSDISTIIRGILKNEENPMHNSELLAELFVEDRKKHLEELIILSIERGINVVCDRYKLSTIAYQSAQGMDMGCLISKHDGLLIPDITFYIDTPYEIAMQRSCQKEKKFENLEFQKKLSEEYYPKAIALLLNNGEKIKIVSGNQPVDIVSGDINAYLDWVFKTEKILFE